MNMSGKDVKLQIKKFKKIHLESQGKADQWLDLKKVTIFQQNSKNQ